MFAKKKKKGFTLIELLVVIAIIGILASIVLVSLSGARNKAKDARITADMTQLRNIAEMAQIDQGDYSTVCDQSEEGTLATDISDQGGTNYNCFDEVAGYCAEAQLNSGNWWCVDATALSKQYPAATPSDCTVTPFTCE